MDIGKEEATLVYEERLRNSMSPPHDEESEDEDNHRELEEMLYSHVFYDDSSINSSTAEVTLDIPSPAQSVLIQNITVQKPLKSGIACSEFYDDPDASAGLRLQTRCTRSQFNHPERRKASRYYDINQDQNNRQSTFVAPQNPHFKLDRNATSESQQFNVPSPMTSRIMARSSNEKIYLPRGSENRKEPLWKKTETMKLKELSPHTSSSEISTQQDTCSSRQAISMTEGGDRPTTRAKETSESVSTVSEVVVTVTDSKQVPIKHVQNYINSKSKGAKVDSCSKTNLQTIEAKISKVMSSMLDEESRSSADENQSVLNCSGQDMKNFNSDSGWSIGMSWDDMSTKYNFEVDSLEEESVSSFQMQEGSTLADSRTDTPDIQAFSTKQADDAEEDSEPSRYSLNLKSSEKHDDEKQVSHHEKQVSHHETDSESEVGSVVEVAPPVKSPPPLVDISDGECAPLHEPTRKLCSKRGSDITVLFNKSKDSSIASVAELIIDSSSDDDLVVLDVIKTPSSESKTVLKGPKKRNYGKTNETPTTGDEVPTKRLSYQRDKISREERGQLDKGNELLDHSPAVLSHTNKVNKLQSWLHNPIQSSKSLGHEKILKKMSDDPSLWQICWADKVQLQSPRGPKCQNCNQFGHKFKMCPSPRKIVQCHMCGAPGHSDTRCTQKMCLRCGKKNNIFTDRCRSCITNSIPCKICNSLVHGWKLCPDLWRRYHLTTSSGGITKPTGRDVRPVSEQWCSNCAANGHLSHDCSKAQWKCESITPYIKSYATPTDEEEQLEGPSTATILLTDADAAVLHSAAGSQFLSSLSEKYQATISSSLDTVFKKVVIEATSLVQEEVRFGIKNWINKQGASFSKQNDADFKRILNNVFPRKPDVLASFLTHRLQNIEKPISHVMSVRELFATVKKLSNNLEPKKVRMRKQYCCLLNTILVGKCGFADGHQHVQSLKELSQSLKKKDTLKLRLQIAEHFQAVFSTSYRENFQNLVEQFYLDETLVKQYDTKSAGGSKGSDFHNQSPGPEVPKVKIMAKIRKSHAYDIFEEDVQKLNAPTQDDLSSDISLVTHAQSQSSTEKKQELLASSSEDEFIPDSTPRRSSGEKMELRTLITDNMSQAQLNNQETVQPSTSESDGKLASSPPAERRSTRKLDVDDMPLSLRLQQKGTAKQRALTCKGKINGHLDSNAFHILKESLRYEVPTVLKNLSSRFISTKEQMLLSKAYKLLFKPERRLRVGVKHTIIRQMRMLTDSLCEKFNVPLQNAINT